MESFRYLGDELCPGGSCELATIARTRAAWGKFRELLALLSSSTISSVRCGMLFNSFVRGALLHLSECWTLRWEDIQRLLRNQRAMLLWMCKVKVEDDVSLHDLYSGLSLQPLESRLRINRLRGWLYGDFHPGLKFQLDIPTWKKLQLYEKFQPGLKYDSLV